MSMLNDIRKQILINLQKDPGIDIYELSKRLKLNRTSLLYHIKHLKSINLITFQVENKKTKYYAASSIFIEKYFEQKVSEINKFKNELIASKDKLKLIARKDLSLAIFSERNFDINLITELDRYYDVSVFSDINLDRLYNSLEVLDKYDVLALDYQAMPESSLFQNLENVRYIHNFRAITEESNLPKLPKRMHFSTFILEKSVLANIYKEFIISNLFRLIYNKNKYILNNLYNSFFEITTEDEILKDYLSKTLENFCAKNVSGIKQDPDYLFILDFKGESYNLNKNFLKNRSNLPMIITDIPVSKANNKHIRSMILEEKISGVLWIDRGMGEKGDYSEISEFPNVFIVDKNSYSPKWLHSEEMKTLNRNLIAYTQGDGGYLLF